MVLGDPSLSNTPRSLQLSRQHRIGCMIFKHFSDCKDRDTVKYFWGQCDFAEKNPYMTDPRTFPIPTAIVYIKIEDLDWVFIVLWKAILYSFEEFNHITQQAFFQTSKSITFSSSKSECNY